MSALVAVADWLDLHGDALSPAAMLFVAVEREGSGCRSCLFAGQRMAVCKAACEMAARSGLLDCDSPTLPGKRIIYIAKEIDSRQKNLF